MCTVLQRYILFSVMSKSELRLPFGPIPPDKGGSTVLNIMLIMMCYGCLRGRVADERQIQSAASKVLAIRQACIVPIVT